MNIYTIYKAINTTNGKCYIGFDSNWPNRMKDHKKNYNQYKSKQYNSAFYNALRKYGWDYFCWEVLYQSKDKEHTLNKMENYFIFENRSFGGFSDCNGYNMTLGGEGALGNKLSSDHKNKISIHQKSRFEKIEERNKHSQRMREWRKSFSEEKKNNHSIKISEALKGNKRALGMTYSHSEEAKLKISKFQSERERTKESIEKFIKSRKGKGTGQTNSMANPENRKKVAESKLGRKKYINIETNNFKYCIPGTQPEGYVLLSEIK